MIAALAWAAAALAAPQAQLSNGHAPWQPNIAPASEEAKLALTRAHVADGYQLSLFAAEPRVANPVGFWIDDSGVFYVAETFRLHEGVTDLRDHMDWRDEDLACRTVEDRVELMRRKLGAAFEEITRASDRVHWLADTDGDGVADADHVLDADFREPSTGVGASVLSRKGNVYYTNIPKLWLLRDPNHDGRLDGRTPLLNGFGIHIAMIGHDLHGLRIGPDGRLYFSCGDRAFHVETPSGVIDHTHTGAVLRCELDGSRLEVFASGLRNPQDLAFDELGNLFTGDNTCDGGDRARWVQVVEGATAGIAMVINGSRSPTCAARGTTRNCGIRISPGRRPTSCRRSVGSAPAPRGSPTIPAPASTPPAARNSIGAISRASPAQARSSGSPTNRRGPASSSGRSRSSSRGSSRPTSTSAPTVRSIGPIGSRVGT